MQRLTLTMGISIVTVGILKTIVYNDAEISAIATVEILTISTVEISTISANIYSANS